LVFVQRGEEAYRQKQRQHDNSSIFSSSLNRMVGAAAMAPKEEAVTTQTLWSPSSSRSSSWSWFTGKVYRTMGCTTTTHHAAYPGQTTLVQYNGVPAMWKQ
jgi:hypothetical protein